MKNCSFRCRLMIAVAFCVIVIHFPVTAQSPFKGFENLFTTPLHYVVSYARQKPKIDGDINDAVWQTAAWSQNFQDIEGDLKPKPALQTNVKMLWDDSCLYIAAKISDPQAWATLKKHDAIIFNDNDFEVFIDPYNTAHRYFEIEYNALNTVFDLFLNKPYRDGGSALINWDVENLISAVKIQGTLNNPNDIDEGWTVEMAIPFKSVSLGNDVIRPKEGSLWRINFSRVEWDTKAADGKYVKLTDESGKNRPEHNWVWSPQGVVNMHYPERWGYLEFTKSNASFNSFVMPDEEDERRYLWLVYYKQKLWYSQHHEYQQNFQALDINPAIKIGSRTCTLQLEATQHQFLAFLSDTLRGARISINQDGLIHVADQKSDE